MTRFDRLALAVSVAVAAMLRLPGIEARGRSMPTRATTCSRCCVHPGRRRSAPRTEDVRRRVPPRRLLLLPARPIVSDLERRSRRGHGVPCAPRDRRGRAHVVARASDRRLDGRRHRRVAARRLAGGDRQIDVHLEPQPDRVLRGARVRGGVAGAIRRQARDGGPSPSGPRAWWSSSARPGRDLLPRDAGDRGAAGPPRSVGHPPRCSRASPWWPCCSCRFSPTSLRPASPRPGASSTTSPTAAGSRHQPDLRDRVHALPRRRLAARGLRAGRAGGGCRPAGLTARPRGVLALRLVAPPERTAIRWFVGLLIWSTLALAFAAPSLLQIVVGLPNDHYHAFLDPWWSSSSPCRRRDPVRPRRSTHGARRAGPAALASVAVGPRRRGALHDIDRPPTSRESIPTAAGRPCATPARSVVDIADGRSIFLLGLPDFKLPDAVGFPIVNAGGASTRRAGSDATPIIGEEVIVVACDRCSRRRSGALRRPRRGRRC